MTLQKRGKQRESEIVNELNRNTGESVRAYPCGDSGNHATASPDILVTVKHGHGVCTVHAIEWKRTSVDAGEYAYKDVNVQQLASCRNVYTDSAVVIEFTNREIAYCPLVDRVVENDLMESLRVPPELQPHVTDGGSLRVTKPDTDEWPSKRGGRDALAVLADACGFDLGDE